MKKPYEEPTILTTTFMSEDIVTASGGTGASADIGGGLDKED